MGENKPIREIETTIDEIEGLVINIGRVYENKVTKLLVDLSSTLIEHPNATASLVVRQPNWQSYPATVTLNGMTLEWLITDAEIGLQSGTGEIQITVADGEQIYKSAIAQTVILPSILYKSESIPDPIAHWISQAQAELEKTKEALNTAQNFIADLKQKLDNGELNGKPGPQGEKGEKGDPGKDAPQEVVMYTAQTLDDSQKAQARENIGAADEDTVSQLKEDLAEYVFSKTKNVNLLDIADSDVRHGFYNSTSGWYTANDNALTSGFIPYESDSVYRFTFPIDWFNYSVTLWDENKLILIADLSSFISKENGYATFSSTTYSNAKYVRFTILDQSKDFSTAMVVKDVEYPSTYIPYGYTVKYSKKLDREIENIAKNINPATIFDNKVMLFTGDSICYGANWRPTVEDYSNTGWRKIIQENYPKSITYGYGIGGTTISKRSGRTDSILERMTTMFSEHPEADYIIIQGGVNDAYNITDCPIGTISTGYTDELNENTFAGALESIFKYTQTNWIGKKIGYIVTFKVPSAMGQFKFNEYMDIAKQICEKWSVPYCDLYNESNLNYYIQEVSNAYGGGLHPNETGYRIITNKIEKWLETL